MDKTDINIKFLEILVNIVREQNMQLLKIIAEEENLDIRELVKLVPTNYQLKQNISKTSQ
jgi:predicted transcriptional regulator